MAKITLQGYQCERCGHQWVPRQETTEEPKVCPKCKSPYWNTPRQRTREGEITQNSDVVNLVTSVTEIRKTDKGQKYLSYEMNVWLDPETRTATLLSMTEPVEIIVG